MRGSYEEADIFLDAVHAVNPSNAVTWVIKGLLYDQIDRPEDALAAYGASRRVNEDESLAREQVRRSSMITKPTLIRVNPR